MEQETNWPPHLSQITNFLFEAITGGEQWSEVSGRRKAVLLLLLFLMICSIILACLQAMPNTLADTIITPLFVWGLVWLWTLILYPRLKHR
jgi:uncharacterized membrane protein YoaK (UPF0700 family)